MSQRYSLKSPHPLSPTESQSLFLLDWDSVKSWITCEHGPDSGLGSEPGSRTSSPSAYSPTVGPVYSLSLKTLESVSIRTEHEPEPTMTQQALRDMILNEEWATRPWSTKVRRAMKTEREITTAAGGEK